MEFLADYGYFGMLIAAFIAGSVFPFSSEVLFVALIAANLDPITLLIYATVGNAAGSMFNYWVGTCGRLDWIERYLHIRPEKIEKAQRFVGGKGAWMGFFTFLPVIGSVLSVALGLMRANTLITATSITLGKFLRYAVLAAITCGATSALA